MALTIGNRRSAQRRQVHPLQRADQERRARGELPVRDDRAERRRREPARPAPRRSSPRSSTPSASCPRPVSFVDIAGIVQGRERGRGARQPVPREHPRGRRDRAGRARIRRRRRRARRRRGRPGSRPRDHQHRARSLADLQTLEKAIPRFEKEVQGQEGRARRARGRASPRRMRSNAGMPLSALEARPRAASASSAC